MPIAIALYIFAATLVQPVEPSREAIFREAMTITAQAFYDPKMNGVDWHAVSRELAPRAAAANSDAELSKVINDALARLQASHTAHYTPDQREYYEILDIFYPDGIPERGGSKIKPGKVRYTGIGIVTKVIDGKTFVFDIYPGGPSDRIGLSVGDQIISVDGAPWGDIAPFRGRENQECTLVIQRSPEQDSRREIKVTPRSINPRELFDASIRESADLIHQGDKTIGYLRVRSYANRDYHERVHELVYGALSTADALIIDIRGGWGGASPQYMDIFNPLAPTLTHVRRDGQKSTISAAWHKPVAMLIDRGSRSGKEMLAHAFKTHKVGLLVGETTAGAVLGGTPRPLSDGSLLFIAVSDVTVDGVRIEGVGVAPDIEMARPIPYCGGKDPQRDAAVKALMQQLSRPQESKEPDRGH